jgi:hypothetical protein
MASEQAWSRRLALLIASGLLLLATGCATAPTGGGPHDLVGQSGQQQAFVQPVPPPAPKADWTPLEVVLGFLAASASFELDPAAARQYLAPKVARSVPWLNRPQASVPDITVVTGWGAGEPVKLKVKNPRVSENGVTPREEVPITGEKLASLTGVGYQYQPGLATYNFVLQNSGGIWLIQSLPPHEPLLLTQTAFQEVFQPRNLYFFGQQDSPSESYLVPDPVYVPLQNPTTAGNTTSLATELVQGLLQEQPWLSTATYTAFPANTTLAAGVTISNLTARVSLVVPGSFSQVQVSQMYDQLTQTLTNSDYDSPQIVDSVNLVINGRPERVKTVAALVPPVGTASALYFAGAGLVGQWYTGTTSRLATPYQIPLGTPIDAIAVSRGSSASPPMLALAVARGNGCEVYVGRTGQAGGFQGYPLSGGACTSLSWDDYPNLWAIAGSDIWVVEHGQSQPLQVDSPVSQRVVALRMAPDGVRVALLVRSPHGTGGQILLAAVTYGTGSVSIGTVRPVGGSALNDLKAIAWYTPDDLVALDGSGLYDVPLTGGVPKLIVQAPSGTMAISSGGSPNVLAVLTGEDQIETASYPYYGWSTVRQINPPAQVGPVFPG